MKKSATENLLSYLYNLPIVKVAKFRNLVVLFLASFLLVVNYFITTGRLVKGVDALMWVSHAEYYSNFNWLYSWYDRTSLGFAKTPSLLETLLGLSNMVMRDPSWAYRIAISVIIFLGSLGSYKYMKHLTNDYTASLAGALFYILNPWVVNEIREGHIDILMGVGMFPLFLFAFEKRDAILAAVLASIFLTAAHPQAIYAFGVFFIAYVLFAFKVNRKNISYLLAVSALTLGLSMFYYMPFLMVNGLSGYSGLGLWTIEDVSVFIMPSWQILIVLLPLLLIMLLVSKFGKEYKYARFYGVVAVLATLLAASPTVPVLDTVYFWIFKNVPLFSMFRVPTRIMMVTLFCTGYTIGIITSRTKNAASSFRLPFRQVTISKSRVYRTVIVGTIAGIFIITSLTIPYTFPGNYTPSSIWTSNYEWLKKQSEDWNVYTLPLTSGWISTPYGATQDYGTLSTLFSDKSVIGIPAKTALSYSFLKYLEHVVKNNITDQWLKLLDMVNVKYVTSGPNMYGQSAFLLRQEGMNKSSLVYVNKDAKVYENPYWTSAFKIVPDVKLLAGGYNTMLSLLRLSFNFNDCGLHFIDAGEKVDSANYSSVIYENFMDYLTLTLDEVVKIHAYQYGVDYTKDPAKDWIQEGRWKIEGKFVLNDLTLSVDGEHVLSIPFTAGEDGMYEVFVRALGGQGSERGYLTVGTTTIQPLWSSNSFKWYDFGEINVKRGQNFLQIANSEGRNDIDEIVLIPQDDFEIHKTSLINELQNYTGRIVLCTKAYNVFNVTEAKRWDVAETEFDCDGYVLNSPKGGELVFEVSVGNTSSATDEVVLPRVDNYTVALRAKTYGNMLCQVDNKTYFNTGYGNYSLYAFQPLSLTEGKHKIRLSFSNAVYVDDVIIYSASEDGATSQGLFSKAANTSITFKKISPAEYVLDIENNGNKSYLIAPISYDERWKAYVNGAAISPVRMNSVLLGFPLDETGDLQVRLVFTGQTYVVEGYSITLAVCAVTFVTVVIRYVRTRKERKK